MQETPHIISLKRELLLYGILSFLIFTMAAFYLNFNEPSHATGLSASTSLLLSGFPVHLDIPSLNVHATLERVGRTPTGALDAPAGPIDAGWFDEGPRPGQIGSAVIDGHSGWKDGDPAVFDRLSQLRVGDSIYVIDDKGTTVAFVARKISLIGEHDDPTDIFISDDGQAHLNLITCGGAWNKVLQSYPNRIVVFADRVDTISPS
jgi:LPXTG-site transpeptidase (sortase) family protein